ncbi:T cell activation RhoGTPase activating protein b [Diretmus argenteus]
MRRGSYDDAAASLRPHLRSLAQRRRSAPPLAFGKALGMPWSPIREEASCWVTAEQSPFVLGLSSENGELLLDECVQVTEGTKTRERHLFLFGNVLVFAKLKSSASYRLKHRVSLEDVWLYGFQDEPEDGGAGDIDLRVTLVMAWALRFCMVSFRSPEVKERWLDTLHRKINEAKETSGCASPPPSVLMKVLSGSTTTKTLTGGGMDPFIESQPDGDTKISALSKLPHNQEDRLAQPIENSSKWNLVRRLRRGSGRARLFGQPLVKTCPDDGSLPRPVTEMLELLWKRGPSTEGVFRKPCNNKNMRTIREQLNGGLEVDLKVQPVVLLVGLLKSFLKELPGSLLVSELYANWMKALDNKDAQQRASEIKSVVNKLPGANRLLLQHLLSVLRHILESADTNKMDAHNLAVCIAPTLLQLDDTPLDEQHDKLKKVTKLTEFLIEHCCEIFGENILNLLGDTDEDNSDSLSSQQHDSAYDSTDPDADGECIGSTNGGAGSSPSLLPSCTVTPSWPSDAMFHTLTKHAFSRRCSEPLIFPSAEMRNLRALARSHDDCSLERRDFEEQPLKKQISDDSFLLGGARPVPSFPQLCSSLNMEPVTYTAGDHAKSKDCSCSSSCSLESAASNQSEGSVFTSSPPVSPTCPRRAPSIHQAPLGAKPRQDIARTDSDGKKRSQSMRVELKAPMRTKSLCSFSFTRGSLKKGEAQKRCGTLKEDSQSEAELPAEPRLKPRPLSAIEVFQQVDSRLPSRPPSYNQAVQGAVLPPRYGSMTVHDAIELDRKSRPSSVNYDHLPICPVNQYSDCFVAEDNASIVERRLPFRQRAMSESASRAHHEGVSRRCSQPVFEEYCYAKESYV